MSGIRPRGSVGVAWQAMKDAQMVEETKQPLLRRNRKATVLAMLGSLSTTDKTQNGCELDEKKICEGLCGSAHATEGKAVKPDRSS